MNNIKELSSELLGKIPRSRQSTARFLLGITGIPASGKSTFAALLVEEINKQAAKEIAVVVPMDGFHLSNETLEILGLTKEKGKPNTFDAEGFVHLVERLNDKTESIVMCPIYDRQSHSAIQNALTVSTYHKIVVIEGNYLLLTDLPWSRTKKNLNEVWFLKIDAALANQRSIARHIEWGKTEEEAKKKLESTDIPNSIIINKTAWQADRIIYMS